VLQTRQLAERRQWYHGSWRLTEWGAAVSDLCVVVLSHDDGTLYIGFAGCRRRKFLRLQPPARCGPRSRTITHTQTHTLSAVVLSCPDMKVKNKAVYSAQLWEARLWSAQVWITQFLTLQTHHTCLYLVALTRWRHQCSDSNHDFSILLIYRPQVDERLSWPS